MPRPHLIFSQSGYFIQIVAINLHTWCQTVQIQISWLLQKPTDLDLHCLQNRVYPGSAGQGLTLKVPFKTTADIILNLFLFYFTEKKLGFHILCESASLSGSGGCGANWWSGSHGFDPHRVWQHSFVKIDHEIFSTVILYLHFWRKNVHNTG